MSPQVRRINKPKPNMVMPITKRLTLTLHCKFFNYYSNGTILKKILKMSNLCLSWMRLVGWWQEQLQPPIVIMMYQLLNSPGPYVSLFIIHLEKNPNLKYIIDTSKWYLRWMMLMGGWGEPWYLNSPSCNLSKLSSHSVQNNGTLVFLWWVVRYDQFPHLQW